VCVLPTNACWCHRMAIRWSRPLITAQTLDVAV
jgi:hypothetical protein